MGKVVECRHCGREFTAYGSIKEAQCPWCCPSVSPYTNRRIYPDAPGLTARARAVLQRTDSSSVKAFKEKYSLEFARRLKHCGNKTLAELGYDVGAEPKRCSQCGATENNWKKGYPLKGA